MSVTAIPAAPDIPAISFRRFAIALAILVLAMPVTWAAFVIAIDPYYIFGSPSWPGINMVRPAYEPHVYLAKPYQVARLRPEAAAFGSSRVEVGIDPRHPGWGTTKVFNFAEPSSNSYAVMLAFLHAQAHGMKRAVIGLDFFAYNINFPLSSTLDERRYSLDPSINFSDFRQAPSRQPASAPTEPGTSASPPAQKWDEKLYLAINPDVAAAIGRGEFTSGRQHYELAGRSEGRPGEALPSDWNDDLYLRINADVAAAVKAGQFVNGYHHYVAAGRSEKREGGFKPPDWNDEAYLQANPDVAVAVADHRFLSGYHHYLAAGRAEKRLGGLKPKEWNEAGYLAANPDVRVRIGMGKSASGYAHYALTGRSQGRVGGLPPESFFDRIRIRWPVLDLIAFRFRDLAGAVFSKSAGGDAVSTIAGQSKPPDFNSLGMRIWIGHDDVLKRLGGPGRMINLRIDQRLWLPVLTAPNFIYCFSDPKTGVSTFDSYRLVLRKAYEANTDLRLYITPLDATPRATINGLDLETRYEYWLRELTRINEQEAARARQQPYPLWDFSDMNSITREPVPAATDSSPMRWFWELSHYRKETGDLILDRIFDHHDPARQVPDDFGVRLTSSTLETHLTDSRQKLDRWFIDNREFGNRIRVATRPGPRNRQPDAKCW